MPLVEYTGEVTQTPQLVEYTGEVEQRRPEDVGIAEGAGAALKRGVESYGDVGAGLGLAGLSITGQEEEARKKMREIKEEAKVPQETPAMTWADFERISEEKGVMEALKSAPKYIVEQVLGNAPQMAGPLAVGAGVGAISGPAGVVTGPLAGIATYGIQQFGNFLVRQAQEKEDPKELEVAKAALTAAGTAPLGYFVDRFTAGIGGKTAVIGKEALAELSKRGVGAAAGAVGKAAGKGATKGVLAEAPTEVVEQVAERYQAGLPLTGEDAKKEYKEAFAGAAAMGGGIGGISTGVKAGRQIAKMEPYTGEVTEKPAKVETTEPAKVEPVEPAPVAGKEPWEEILIPPVEEKQPVIPAGRTVVEKPPITPVVPMMPSKKGKIEGVEEIRLDPNELKLSQDVPQFKEDADVMGIVEPLQGKEYDYVGTPPIQVWRRLNGDLEIISGRHRWDLAKRTGAEYIPTQVFDEAKGFNADMAAIMDAELNIRDGKGKVTDYVNYFTEAGNRFGLTKQDYKDRGLLDSEKGRKAYTVSVQGSDELIQALRGRQVKEDTAYRIADAVPNDARLQALGLKLVNEKPLEQAINILHAAKTIEPKQDEAGDQGNLFGFDDSGLKLAEDMGSLALKKQRDLSEDILAIKPAAKRAEKAAQRGVKVGNPEKVLAEAKKLEELRKRWDNWASDPELVDQIRRELAGEVVEPVAAEAKPEKAPSKKPANKALQETEAAIKKKAKEVYDLSQEATKNTFKPTIEDVEKLIREKGMESADKTIAGLKKIIKEARLRDKAADEAVAKKKKAAEKPAEESLDEQYKKAFEEMAKIKTELTEAKKAGKDVSELTRLDEEATRKALELGAKADAARKEQREAKAEGDKVKSVKMRRGVDGTDYLVTLNDGRTAVIYKSPAESDGGLGAWHIDEADYDVPGPSRVGHVTSVLGYTKNEAVAAVAEKLDRIEKYRRKPKAETLPSFQLEPEKKQTPAEKKAAAELEEKQIADREVEFFKLTPRTPEQGAGNYLQQDMIGAMGLTEAEFKKGIDKKSTEPGEPLILRDVTMNEDNTYNDDANKKVDEEIVDQYDDMANVKDVEVAEDVVSTLDKQAQAVEDYVNLASQGKVTAEEFMKSVREAAAKGDIEPDVYNAIEKIYKMAPSVLDGIRFEIATQGNKRRGRYLEVGHYQPLARMIRLFKDTAGVMNPATVRHEIAHTMEQMMTPEQKRMVIRAWRDELIRATRAETTDAGHIFFQNVAKFLHSPGIGTYKNVIKSMPNESYYQYVNPSEYWAVNAEHILKSREAGKSGLKSMVEKLHEGLKQSFGMSNFWVGNKVFDQILTGDRFSNKMLIAYIRKTKMRNYLGEAAPLATWDSMGTSWLEDQKYKYVDKYIDLLRAKQDIERMTGEVSEDVDAYVKETLSHSRISTRIKDFMRDQVAKLANVMRENNISQQQLHEYLLARHAPEYNRVVGQRNPEMGDMAAGITTAEAENYIRALGDKRIEQLNKAAKEVDRMTQSTRDILVEGGIETKDTVDAWEKMFEFYTPMYRKDLEYTGGKLGIGKGFKVQGKFSKAAMGSTKEVADISESIIKDHIRAIEKAERSRVSRALFGMALENPNPDFWMAIDPSAVKDEEATEKRLRAIGVDEELIKNLMQPPKTGVINPETGLVEYRTSRVILQSDNVLATRIDGHDVYVVFNNSDPRARRLASAMQNMDLPDVEGFYRASAYVTRWFAMVNTQLNPIFGLWNFARDVQGAVLNLSTTPLKGLEKQILKDSFANVKTIYKAIRQERATGERATTVGSSDWYDFQEQGGTTGYKAQFVKPKEETAALEDAIKDLNRGKPMKIAKAITNWISDYNDTLENAVRLAAYKAALAKGLSKQQAADIGKNLTVNFNRKGANTQILGSLFAFFNASVQGTSRLYQTLKGPNGKKIMFGGFMIGVVQSAMMSLAGLGEDEPPEFVKEKNFIFPIGLLPGVDSKKYISFPMPLGFNVFPGMGRIMGEAVIGASQGRDVSKKFFDALSLVANSFNPLGSSGLSLQTITPTPLDPLVAISQNKDAFGRPIYKADRETNPQVGYARTRDTTDAAWKNIAKFVNYATGGTEDIKGVWSPTGDEIAYLAGQVTGGLGREAGKIYGAATDFIRGDEIPPYKIPLFGKLYGDAESKASVKNRFYANVTKLAEVERTIKGKKGRNEDVSAYRREHPEAQLVNVVNRIENEITQLNQRRKKLIERGATIQQIKQIEDIKERKMRMLNERYDKLR